MNKPVIAQLIDEGCELQVQASAEGKGSPSFSGVAYSGGLVPSHTLNQRIATPTYVIDLAGMTQGRNVKANLDHKRTQRVGHLTEYDNDGKRLAVTGLLSAATEHRDLVANSPDYGWDSSIETNLSQPESVPRGKTAQVNGRSVSGPTTIFRKSVLTGLAFVDRGADPENAITVAASDEPKLTTLRELREAAN